MVAQEKPRVFISYAHKDAWEFTQRLYFALEVYLGRENLFWDKMIPPGPFPAILGENIRSCQYFLAVMSPYAQREEGWCRKELAIALESQAHIIPLRISEYSDQKLVDEHEMGLTYADFTEDFDVGFRQLTNWILGEPVSSWEYLSAVDDKTLLEHLESGNLPCPISREIDDWVIVEQLWAFLDEQLPTDDLLTHSPRTPAGILSQADSVVKFAASNRDAVTIVLVTKIKEIVKEYLSANEHLTGSDHVLAGQNTMNLIKKVEQFLISQAAARRDAEKLAKLQASFRFGIAERIRKVIAQYSRGLH